MKLLEHEAKQLFKNCGIPVPPSGGVISSTAYLSAALKKAGKGPWVLKAQVLAGGRGKAGGIKIAKTPVEAKKAARAMLGMKLVTAQTHGQALIVKELLIDKSSDISREIYISVVLDRKSARPVVIASAEGGVSIEELAATRPELIIREPVDPSAGLADFQARRLAYELKIPRTLVSDFISLAKKLARLFLDLDAGLVEVNPLIITRQGGLFALDAKIVTDDNALFRHKELQEKPDHESTPAEKLAKKAGINYVGLDGNIGCMVNGAGLAMATMDTIKLAGGEPANFLDVGGGATAEQVTRAFQIILRDPKVKSVLVNIFGGIMKCDVIAQGIIEAVKKVKLSIPLVIRLEGTRVKEGKLLLENSGIKIRQADSLWNAAQKAVAAVKQTT
ncbi:MAG: ADP-forming succinate--CoA ligase subunit beta [bacterium]